MKKKDLETDVAVFCVIMIILMCYFIITNAFQYNSTIKTIDEYIGKDTVNYIQYADTSEYTSDYILKL